MKPQEIARAATLAATLGAAILAVGCSAGGSGGAGKAQSGWSGEAATLVVYAQSIPLYPGAKAEDAMGSDSYGDTPEEHSEGMSVWFKVEGYDQSKVLAWYEERLTGYQRSTLEDDTVELRMPAPGGEPGEEVGVWIDVDGFRVFEDTKPGKHRG